MKLFISQPMRGKTDADILSERNEIVEACKKEYGDLEVIDSFFDKVPVDAPPLWCLGKSIQLMGTATAVFFAEGWQQARGCHIEHEVAQAYGIEILHD